jgi:hypothetical protein
VRTKGGLTQEEKKKRILTRDTHPRSGRIKGWEKAPASNFPTVPATRLWRSSVGRGSEDICKPFKSTPVPRTARARKTVAPRTTRPVALTLRQDRRHLWQAQQATLHLRHNDRVKKVRHVVRFRILFHFLFLSLASGIGKEDTPKGILLREGNGPRAPLLIRGSKAGPLEGFNSPSERSGSAPTTGQRFEGRPLGRVQRSPQATRAPRPLLIRGS